MTACTCLAKCFRICPWTWSRCCRSRLVLSRSVRRPVCSVSRQVRWNKRRWKSPQLRRKPGPDHAHPSLEMMQILLKSLRRSSPKNILDFHSTFILVNGSGRASISGLRYTDKAKPYFLQKCYSFLVLTKWFPRAMFVSGLLIDICYSKLDLNGRNIFENNTTLLN